MNRFEQSKLWQNSLAPKLHEDVHAKERELLRIEYEKFRERAAIVAQEIIRDLPEFTVHDITHIDFLWNLADLITVERFELTPTEAFVLGGAFLIHDLGMGLAAYPDGIEQLKKTTIWKDTVSHLIKKESGIIPNEEEITKPSPQIEKKALENVLRILHAKHAEQLALIKWKDSRTGGDYFLIDNIDLRESYGKIIGLIAHSHWWSVEDLSKRLKTVLGAPSKFPQEWTIDPIKLATILRIADASNIDDSRSPGFLKALRKLKGYSETHWNFQNKLYQPRLEKERLVYTSKMPFKITEADSWWLCYDTLKLLDSELRDVDSLLSETNRQRLSVIGVAGIDDPERLSKLITVENWKPVDTQIKVGDVAQLALRLGGTQLYGNNYSVPVRELIQNAADAIRARRILENETDTWGEIIIRNIIIDSENVLEIEDNGIGMSPKVLTGPFLDFGQSFWGSALMHEELPGLESKHFKSTGKYGIGFFSAFMIGSKITVFSRRYEAARSDTWCLEFYNGVYSRPILRKANSEEYLKDGGTKIRLHTSDDFWSKFIKSERYNGTWSIVDILKKMCICVDTNIKYFDGPSSKPEEIVQANDWLTIPFMNIIEKIVGSINFKKIHPHRMSEIVQLAEREMMIEQGGTIVARGVLHGEMHFREGGELTGLMVVGGFSADIFRGIIGVMESSTDKASRDKAIPNFSVDSYRKFIESQIARIIVGPEDSIYDYYSEVAIATRLNCNTQSLPIAIYKDKIMTFSELVELVMGIKSDLIFLEAERSAFEQSTGKQVKYLDNVIACERHNYYFERWLDDLDLASEALIFQAVSTAWKIEINELKKFIVDTEEKILIGHSEDIEVFESSYTLIKYPY